MAEHTTQYNSAASLMRAHGIVSIIFGALGTLFSLLLVFLFLFAVTDPNSSDQVVGGVAMAIVTIIFGILPHCYLLIAGTYLAKNPRPSLAKGLTITNLVIGVFYNLPILILAIISLTQLGDYEHGFKNAK